MDAASTQDEVRCLRETVRGPYQGIHAITEPVWKLERYARESFSFAVSPQTTRAAN